MSSYVQLMMGALDLPEFRVPLIHADHLMSPVEHTVDVSRPIFEKFNDLTASRYQEVMNSTVPQTLGELVGLDVENETDKVFKILMIARCFSNKSKEDDFINNELRSLLPSNSPKEKGV